MRSENQVVVVAHVKPGEREEDDCEHFALTLREFVKRAWVLISSDIGY